MAGQRQKLVSLHSCKTRDRERICLPRLPDRFHRFGLTYQQRIEQWPYLLCLLYLSSRSTSRHLPVTLL
jgi:hypothetical protein